jgi:hypothetical protein
MFHKLEIYLFSSVLNIIVIWQACYFSLHLIRTRWQVVDLTKHSFQIVSVNPMWLIITRINCTGVIRCANSVTDLWIPTMPWKSIGGVDYSSTHSLTSALDGGEWLASRRGRFNPKERALGTHLIGGWVGPRAVLDAMVKRKIPSPRRESNPRTPIVQPVAQRYTDWAIAALVNPYNRIKFLVSILGCRTSPSYMEGISECFQ